MKYNHMFKDLPQDIRPMGTNNLNQLVHHHLGSNSFDVVANIQSNISWLYDLYKHLPRLQLLAQHTDSIKAVGENTKTLYAIGCSMDALSEVYLNLDKLKLSAKEFHEFNHKLEDLDDKMSMILGHINEDSLNHLVQRYNQVEAALSDQENIIKAIKDNETALNSYYPSIMHLLSTDAVRQAETSKMVKDITKAKDLIKLSEEAGNDESFNKEQLEKINV